MIEKLILIAISRLQLWVQVKHLLCSGSLPNEEVETAVSICTEHYAKTGTVPTPTEYKLLGVVIPPNEEVTDAFIVEQIFKHYQKIRIGEFLTEAVHQYDAKLLNVEEAAEEFKHVILDTSPTDIGAKLHVNITAHVKDAIAFSNRPRIFTGISGVDSRIGGGIGKQELMFFVAPPGRGKTTFLINVFYNGLLQGWNGLFLSLELSEASIKERFFRRIIYGNRKELRDTEKSTASVEKFFRLTDSRAILKYERPNKITIDNLAELVYKIKMIEDVNLDFMCIDYVDKLAPTKYTRKFEIRHQIREMVNDLRNLGVEYNLALASATQANRESVRNGRVTEIGIAEGYAKAEAADIIVALNKPQTDIAATGSSPTEVAPDDNDEFIDDTSTRILPKVVNILKNRDHPPFDGDIPIFIVPDMMLISDNLNLLPLEVFNGKAN